MKLSDIIKILVGQNEEHHEKRPMIAGSPAWYLGSSKGWPVHCKSGDAMKGLL
jgi:hypothetical protein